ncbi:uncharacterized protein LOC122506352 [Leptopilina heterotoma]|uniref:uncharacterized protein LOC122506352 n=1 Tax=Leptopilina heterotoma TaxID=63436 RepID=UPI001CA841E1|nr:uncharacterized protein LOC122506352 [Leptopilina heterotoma]
MRTHKAKSQITSNIPTFDGKIEDWLSFKNSFSSLIHEQTDLTNIEKLQYLKSALKGEAARKISIFPISENNYLQAWELLEKTNGDKRLIISRHLSLILRLPVQEKQTSEGLIKLADETQQHRLSLMSLGVNISEEILVQNIEEKLHKSTLDKWDETLKRNEFPKLDDLFEFLYRTATRLTQREVKNPPNPKITNNAPENKKKTFKGANPSLATSILKPCPACRSKTHHLFCCEKFRAISVPERIQIITDASYCMNCMRDNHRDNECKFGNCMVCGEKHNTLLHQEIKSPKK